MSDDTKATLAVLVLLVLVMVVPTSCVMYQESQATKRFEQCLQYTESAEKCAIIIRGGTP